MDCAFGNAVNRFRESLTKSQREQFAHCQKEDVERTILNIQARHGSQKRLKHMRRISKFIEGMSQLGEVIEVFLNVNNGVAFVWGPIKFLLVAASTWIETLDLLLETYAEIGEALPGLSQYSKLFGSYPFIQKHLENYYCDVLEFNRSALEVFARPGWKTVFHSSWRTFKSQFGPILSSMKRHQQLLAEEKLNALMSEVQTLHHHAEEKFQSLEKEANARHTRESERELAEIEETRHRQRRIVQRKLDAPDFLKDHEHASQMRQTSSSGNWILLDPGFQEWSELDTFSSKRFYLNGIPGAGKTILVSRIIDHLKDLQAESNSLGRKFSVIYFYFKHLHDNKRRMTHLLLGLLSQLSDQDSSLLDFLYREFCSIDQQKLSSHKLCDLASTALKAQRRCFVVIDGLDECAGDTIDSQSNEAERVLQWFEQLMSFNEEATPDTDGLCIRLLVSGQRDGHLEEKLDSYPSIQLEKTAGHSDDIKSYAKDEAVKVCKQFSAGMEVERDIIQKVTTRAKGMFLFAKIVLENLCHQISVFDFKNELEAKNFPEGLDKAYERVVKRVLGNPIKPHRLAAQQILGCVVSAERPLRWREIQSRFCIDPEAGIANIERKSVKPCKYLCGSLVEVGMMEAMSDPQSDGEVEMVHSSAKAYLIQTKALCLATEHAKAALFCAQFLTSRPLRLGIEREIQECAFTGYYGFHDYATAFWWNHVNKLIEAREKVSLDIYRRTLHSVAKLLKTHLISTDMCEEELEDIEAIALRFAELPSILREREKVLSLEFCTERVRDAIEAIKDGRDKTHIADEMNTLPLYGPIRYKCPKPWCGFFSTGFATREERKDHVNEHDRPFRCLTEGCYHVDIGFSTESGLNQHVQSHHTQPEITLFPKPRKPGKRKGDIFTATKEGDLDTVKDLVESGINLKNMIRTAKGETTLLMLAVEHGHLDVCKYLLNGGADPNFPAVPEGESILHKAIQRNDVEVIEVLLKQDEIALGVTVQSFPALGLAAVKDHSLSLFKVTKPRHKRISLGHETQQDQIRMAHMVSREDKTSMCISQSFIDTLSKTSNNMLKLLITLDWPDESSQTGSWCTLLHIACRRGAIRLARRLIFLDREPDRQDHAGRTPLALAADLGSIDLVSALLESGRVIINRLSTPEQSVLVKCAKYNGRITERLLEADPSLVAQSDPDGTTLLHHAIFAGNNELVRYLIIHTDVDVNTLLQSQQLYERPSRPIDPALITPLRMALELAPGIVDWNLLPEVKNKLEWKAESFGLISEALLVSDRVDLSSLECREELHYLAVAAKLGSKSLTWSLIEKGLLSSWEGPHRNQEHVTELMVVLREDIELLIAAATNKRLLSATLNILVETLTNGKRRGGFLTLIISNFRIAKEVFMRGSISADPNAPEENRLAVEEAVRREENDLVYKMIIRGFDGNIALLLAAEKGSKEMVEAILQTGMVDLNARNKKGERAHLVAYVHGNSAIYSMLKRSQISNSFGRARGGLAS